MSRPDFIVIGCQRCGTTWLYDKLKQHPEIQMATHGKEVHFFDRYYDRGSSWYRSRFPESNNLTTGEITPRYIYEPEVPERIQEVVPDVRLIALFRDPVERICSHYRFFVRERGITKDFEEFVSDNPDALKRGNYHTQVQRYLNYFDREQFHPVLFERMVEEPEDVLQSIYSFLSLDDQGYAPDNLREKENTSSMPRFHDLYVWLKSLSRTLHDSDLSILVHYGKKLGLKEVFVGHTSGGQEPVVSEQEKQELRGYYTEEVRNLNHMIDFPLTTYWETAREGQ